MIEIQRMDDTSHLQWPAVVRLFVGGPLDGRAIEGADDREYEAGPCDPYLGQYWVDGWLRYDQHRWDDDLAMSIYVLNPAVTLAKARSKYLSDEFDLAEFEEAVGWALAAEEQQAQELLAAV